MTTISGSISPSVIFTTPVRAAVKSADQPPTVVVKPANLAVEQKMAFTREAASPAAPPSQANTTVVANDSGTPGAPLAEQPRGVYFATGKNEKYLAKPVVQTPEIKAEIARVRAEGNKAREEMEKFMESAGIPVPQKTQPTGPIYYILPQIEGLSQDGVKNVMEMTKLLSESGKAVNTPVKGHYGDKEITDLAAYRELLTDYLGKIQTAKPNPAAAIIATLQAGNAAASSYRQVRDLLGQA